MSSIQKHYLLAVKALIKDGVAPTALFDGLKSTLDRRGHSKLYPSILRSLTRSLEENVQSSVQTLVVAKAEDAKRFMPKDADEATSRIVVDESIVGGHIFTKDWVRTDDSHKTKLLTWYRRSVK